MPTADDDPLLGLVGRGAGLALAVAAPAALLAQVVDAATDGTGVLAYLLALVVLTGIALGGWTVGTRTARILPAALAGLIAVLVVQVLGIVRRAVADEDVAWSSVPVVTLLAVALATGAAAVAARRTGRTRP